MKKNIFTAILLSIIYFGTSRTQSLDLERVTYFGKSTTPLLNRQLFIAIDNGDLEKVKLLVEQGANVNCALPDIIDGRKYNNDHSPLNRAVNRNHIDIVKFLIAKGADVNARYKTNDLMPLHYAQNADIAQVLIDNGAIIDPATRSGQTPLFQAALHRRYDVVRLLLANRADIYANCHHGQTPFHIACGYCNKEIVVLFLKLGYKVNTYNVDGKSYTPLHKAAMRGGYKSIGLPTPNFVLNEEDKEIIELLLANGIDKHIKDVRGKTAAEYRINEEVKELINNYMAVVQR